ncbi:hypothetical protein ACIRQP_40925 [Streptomyces sp. NPDC102274]
MEWVQVISPFVIAGGSIAAAVITRRGQDEKGEGDEEKGESFDK